MCRNKPIGKLYPSLTRYGESFIDTRKHPTHKKIMYTQILTLYYLLLSFDFKTRTNEYRKLVEKPKWNCHTIIAQEGDVREKESDESNYSK